MKGRNATARERAEFNLETLPALSAFLPLLRTFDSFVQILPAQFKIFKNFRKNWNGKGFSRFY
jgi:hypothetical protein